MPQDLILSAPFPDPTTVVTRRCEISCCTLVPVAWHSLPLHSADDRQHDYLAERRSYESSLEINVSFATGSLSLTVYTFSAFSSLCFLLDSITAYRNAHRTYLPLHLKCSGLGGLHFCQFFLYKLFCRTAKEQRRKDFTDIPPSSNKDSRTTSAKQISCPSGKSA